MSDSATFRPDSSPLSVEDLNNKTFLWRTQATAPLQKRFQFDFGADGSFKYESSEAPDLPVAAGAGSWLLEGKKIRLAWKQDGVEGETGDAFSELYTDLKCVHASMHNHRRFSQLVCQIYKVRQC